MIRAVIFDLDGTLVQTEKLKALSYAMAVQQLLGNSEPDTRAIEAYREVVGAAREIVSRHLMERLGLEATILPLVAEYRVSHPSEVLTVMRLAIYDKLVADPQVLRDNQWPHTVAFLHLVRRHGCKTGLATMSHRQEAQHVLRALGLEGKLDVVLTRDDVQHPKPDPEIYRVACRLLGVSLAECLAIEDSATGVRAALAAGITPIAVATPFTRQGLHAAALVPSWCLVEEPERLLATVERCLQERNPMVGTAGGIS